MKTIVIHHSADFDGIFCREIARYFLPDAELIGWDFGDDPIALKAQAEDCIIVMDLPLDAPFGLKMHPKAGARGFPDTIQWIDHHKTAIESHPTNIPGIRIDGVAACRLAWQWFTLAKGSTLTKANFVNREVVEPWAVRLAGEYDIWDKRDPDAELFQHGLRSEELYAPQWEDMLKIGGSATVVRLLNQGRALQYAKSKENESVIKHLGFTIQFEGLTFLACNHARYNSLLFTAGLTPEHDGCFGFKYSKGQWNVSLYHAPGKEHHDLSAIAKKYGGGGHRGACGFRTSRLPFLEEP